MDIRPLHDRVVVKRIASEETSKGGIVIPDTAREKPQEGEVLAVGNGKRCDDGTLQPLEVKAGDKILFSKYGGTEIKIEGRGPPDHARGRHPRRARLSALAHRAREREKIHDNQGIQVP